MIKNNKLKSINYKTYYIQKRYKTCVECIQNLEASTVANVLWDVSCQAVVLDITGTHTKDEQDFFAIAINEINKKIVHGTYKNQTLVS